MKKKDSSNVQQKPKDQGQPKAAPYSPLNDFNLVNKGVELAQSRGAFNLNEASMLAASLARLTNYLQETEQAKQAPSPENGLKVEK